jgi:hypothetical protein
LEQHSEPVGIFGVLDHPVAHHRGRVVGDVTGSQVLTNSTTDRLI